MTTIRIGLSETLEAPDAAFERLNLHLYGGRSRDNRNVWWETPVRWLGEAGVVRLAGVSIVWGPADQLPALVMSLPEPTCIVIPFPRAPQPDSIVAEHVVWIDDEPEGLGQIIEVECLPERSSEFRFTTIWAD